MYQPMLDTWQYKIEAATGHGNIEFGKWRCNVGKGLGVLAVTDQLGVTTGYLLGFPIDIESRTVISSDWQAPSSLGDSIDEFVDTVLCSLAGRFLYVFHARGETRLYPDSSAQISCVFDPVAKAAASTAFSLLNESDYKSRFNDALYQKLGVDGEGWFPAGLTAHTGVERLLPNHFLNLSDWQQRRFWPTPETRHTLASEQVMEQIIGSVKAQIEALLKQDKRVAMALTAGYETRTLLACAKAFLDEFDCVTVVGDGKHEIDTTIALQISKEFLLKHIVLKRETSTQQQRDLFILRGGHCNADSNSRFHPSIWPIANSHIFLGGLGGEVARAFLWRDSDTENTRITPELLIKRFGLPHDDVLTKVLQNWLKHVPTQNAFEVLDLAYVEHRMGPWYAAQFCCDPTIVRHAPLFTVKNTRAMMSLPSDWKRNNQLNRSIIDCLWPELAKYPFNSLGRFTDFKIKVQRTLRDPRLLLKKFRKLNG